MRKHYGWLFRHLLFDNPQNSGAPPVVGGGGGTPPPTLPPAAAPVVSGHEAGEVKSFTQPELDALFGERAKRASEKAVSDLLTDLGVKTSDEVKSLLVEARTLREAQMSELEKAKAQTAEAVKAQAAAEVKAADVMKRANERLIKAQVEAEARKAGVRDEALPDVLLVVDRTKIAVGDDDTVTGADAALKDALKSRAHWLASAGSPGHGTPTPASKRKGAPPPAKPGGGVRL